MLILKLLVFAIPPTISAILHMVVVKYNWFSILNYPLDFYKKIGNKRIFGNSKTFRGLLAMVILSVPSTYLLYWLTKNYESIYSLNIINFETFSPLVIGIAYGLGYVIAELPNSFAKRISGIEEGKPGKYYNVMIDQADSPIGCMLALWAFSDMNIMFFIAGTFFYLALHMFFNVLLYSIGLRKNPL
ncbi:MAG: CDP-archaeol synthase [Bacteroidetes bacterium]|nr:CDP-archaeol synthase [Bacteroidota bacterium]